MNCQTWSPKHIRILTYIGLSIITIAAYWRVTSNEFILIDDIEFIANNFHVSGGFTLENVIWAFTTIHWHPLSFLTLMLDVQIFGPGPFGHHITNLLLHTLNSLFLLFLLNRLTGEFNKSALVAALFALHPLHVESVAWAFERKDVLSVLFGLLTIFSYSRFVVMPNLSRYLTMLCLFAMSLMSKPMLVTMPLVLLMLDFWPLRRLPHIWGNTGLQTIRLKSLLLEKFPLLLAAVASMIQIVISQQHMTGIANYASPIRRVTNAFVAYIAYLGKIFWPINLAVFYPFPDEVQILSTVCAMLIIATITLAAIRVRTTLPCFVFGWLWYLVTLIPVIGFVRVSLQGMADRYTYFPSIGIFIMFVWGMAAIVPERWQHGKAMAAGGIGILMTLFVLTWEQVSYWHDTITLFDHSVSVTGNNYHANTALVVARRLKKTDELLLRGHDNLFAGRVADAYGDFGEILALSPDDSITLFKIATEFKRFGDCRSAILFYERSLKIDPEYVPARHGLTACQEQLRTTK